MRAKIINEIVRGKESGIASLGIGKTDVCVAYDYLEKYYPEHVKKLASFDNENAPSYVKHGMEKTCEYFNCSINSLKFVAIWRIPMDFLTSHNNKLEESEDLIKETISEMQAYDAFEKTNIKVTNTIKASSHLGLALLNNKKEQ